MFLYQYNYITDSHYSFAKWALQGNYAESLREMAFRHIWEPLLCGNVYCGCIPFEHTQPTATTLPQVVN